jgi:hypothetical protein
MALAALVLLVVGIGVAGAVWGDGDWGRHGNDVVSRTVSQDGTETIVVREGHRGFFPFWIFLFPLVIFFWIAVFRALVFRGPWGRGPWTSGGPPANGAPAWFDEWHRRAHQPPPGDQSAGSQAPSGDQQPGNQAQRPDEL